MIAVDTNILIYAHRSELPQHHRARDRLIELMNEKSPWFIPVFCLGEFLRVATHPRVLDPPSPLSEAIAFLGALLQSPSVGILRAGNFFSNHLFEICEAADARGNLVYDAMIAALLRENGVTRLLSEDRDFSRFSGVELVTLSG